MTETKTIEKSSNIKEIEYDGNERKLWVTFVNGSKYSYTDVPPNVFEDFALAESAGKYFHKNIRGKYDHEKLPDSEAGNED